MDDLNLDLGQSYASLRDFVLDCDDERSMAGLSRYSHSPLHCIRAMCACTIMCVSYYMYTNFYTNQSRINAVRGWRYISNQ